ncbi:hypothetical protein FRB99_000766 [Tulasnella sp. 403]|nr:hypothetical protein FRB99_000766 [Tulasnella sp. 403]
MGTFISVSQGEGKAHGALESRFNVNVQCPVELIVGTSFSVPVTLPLGDLRGRLGQRLELVFENRAVQQSFTIVRPVRAILGVQTDQDTLLTKIPYVRRPRRVRTGIIAPIPGPLPPSCTSIKYVMKLPEYPLDPKVIVPGSEAERMEVIRRLLPQELSAETYRRFWQTLLFVEEHQMKMDFEAYDLFDVTLRIEGAFYLWFEGRVHTLRDKEVGLKFAPSFQYNMGDLLEARFSVGRVPMRRMHQALHCPFFPARVVFPEAKHIQDLKAPTPEDMRAVQVYNPHLATNEPQLKAVTAIVNRPPGSVPFVIFGPPGTGKTVTLVEAIRQILARNPNARILACTPSNSAADLITQRLADLGPAQLFRMNAPSRWQSRVPQDVRPFTFTDTRGYFSVAGATQIESFRVVVSTCISAAIPYGVGVTPGHFTHVFVDEAGQAMEPEIMIPIKTISGPFTNIILSGDPKQLGPVIRSNVANELGLGKSLLSRLMEREVYDESTGSGITMVKLTKNWRSHESIIHFSSDTFYGGDLQICASPEIINSYVDSSILATPGFPVVFHGIDGRDDREADSPSYFNIDELSLVVEYVERLRSDPSRPLTDADIGIIAPYNAQGRKLRLRLKGKYGGIKVGSVEEFQGQERKVILITTVRSTREKVSHDLKYMLGFLINPRRLNVALTRAKALMIIVGNPHILGIDPLWKKFLTFVYRQGGFKGLGPNWNTEDAAQPTPSGSNDDPDGNHLTGSAWNLMRTSAESDEEEDFVLIGKEDKPWREDE